MTRGPFLAENNCGLRGMLLETLSQDVMITYIYHEHILRSAGGEYLAFQSEVPR